MTTILVRGGHDSDPPPSLPSGGSPTPPVRPGPGHGGSATWLRFGPLAFVLGANVLVLGNLDVSVIRPLAGLYLALGLPAYLIWRRRTSAAVRPADRPELVVYSVVGALVVLVVLGLAVDKLLPLLGVARPLDRIPVALSVTAVVLGGLLLDRRAVPAAARQRRRDRLTQREQTILVLAPLCTALAAIGATRLNNGADGTVTAVMLGLAGLTFALMLAWRFVLRLTVTLTGIYFVALAMLLMTSLRGWDITGHDLQREYYFFQLTQAFGSWDARRFEDAYNACLSITVLPAMLAGLTGLSGVQVFKLIFQVLFALCPVMVFLIARRFGSKLVALLATVYFVAFPTFFTDMPFLCRQQIGFLTLGATLLVATNGRWPRRSRLKWVMFFLIGTVLSHYSTTYVLIALIAISVLIRTASWCGGRLHDHLRPDALAKPLPPVQAPVLGGVVLVALVTMTVTWTGLVTHTGSQLERTSADLIKSLLGGPAARSADVSYSLFAPPPPPPAQRLAGYNAQVLASTKDERAAGRYYPLDVVGDGVVLAPTNDLPLTVAGRALSRIGIDVAWINTATRQGAAYLLQILTCAGLLIVALRRRAPGWRSTQEVYLLAVASLVVVALQVVLPSLSVDYGVLRAFQQGLFLLAPFLAAGGVQLFSLWDGVWASRLAIGTAMAFFFSLVGLVPQVLGGYGAQLHLNNAGQYYELYVIDPQEAAAAAWLRDAVQRRGRGEIQMSAPDDRYSLDLRYNYPDISVSGTYPALLRPWGYVLLTRTTQVERLGAASVNGDTLRYVYPVQVLDDTKDVIYSSGTVAVYR